MAWNRLVVYLIGSTLLPGMADGGDWTQFRGPNNSGVAEASHAPAQWSDDKNLAWKQTIPGYGWSSPIVVGDKLLVTTAVSENQQRPQPFNFGGGDFGPPGRRGFGPPGRGNNGPDRGGPPGGFGGGRGGPGGAGGFGGFGNAEPPDVTYRWEIHCLDRHTGEQIWSQVALERKPAIAATMGNTYASETPISDGERVYAYFGMHGLYCYDLEGKPVWHKEFSAFPMMFGWGTGSSPALDGGRLFILCDNEQASFLAALDAKTGDEAWRVVRDEKSNWATPFVWRNKFRTEIVAAGGKAIQSFDPSDGNLLWELRRAATGGPSNVSATPVADDAMLYVGAGTLTSFGPLWAVNAGAEGDISLKQGESVSDHIAWSNTNGGPPLASPLLYEGHIYILAQSGILACYDAKSGDEVYKKRLIGARSFTSSPWAHDDKVYCLADDGQAFVVTPGPQFEQLAKNQIEDMFWATPAVANDALYLRGADHVYCIKE